MLTARLGMGDAMEEAAEAKREEGEEGELEEGGVCFSCSDFFGLVRPGGGPEEEAMPGAMAQQARRCGCVYWREDRKGEWGEREHTGGKGGMMAVRVKGAMVAQLVFACAAHIASTLLASHALHPTAAHAANPGSLVTHRR